MRLAVTHLIRRAALGAGLVLAACGPERNGIAIVTPDDLTTRYTGYSIEYVSTDDGLIRFALIYSWYGPSGIGPGIADSRQVYVRSSDCVILSPLHRGDYVTVTAAGIRRINPWLSYGNVVSIDGTAAPATPPIGGVRPIAFDDAKASHVPPSAYSVQRIARTKPFDRPAWGHDPAQPDFDITLSFGAGPDRVALSRERMQRLDDINGDVRWYRDGDALLVAIQAATPESPMKPSSGSKGPALSASWSMARCARRRARACGSMPTAS